jgi:hypothetical protein
MKMEIIQGVSFTTDLSDAALVGYCSECRHFLQYSCHVLASIKRYSMYFMEKHKLVLDKKKNFLHLPNKHSIGYNSTNCPLENGTAPTWHILQESFELGQEK